MRSMWTGVISFGLVTIPVRLYTAMENKEIKFNYLHEKCKTPIKYEKICRSCETPVSMDEIVRGYEYEKGKYVVINDKDLDGLPLDTLKSINILDFVDMREVDPVYYLKAYFIAPGDFGAKAYRLLHDALKDTGKVAVAKVVLRTKENLALVRLYRNGLMLETMYYPDEIREIGMVEELAELNNVKTSPQELALAKQLISSLSTSFKPEKYTSEYREALRDLIEARINHEEVAIPEKPEVIKVVDLMEALKASIESRQASGKISHESRQKVRT